MFDGILNIAGMEFTEVVINPSANIPALSIAARGTITANQAFIKSLGDTKRVRIYQTDGFKHIALLPFSGEDGQSYSINANSRKVGSTQLEAKIRESGIRLPADCPLVFDEAIGAWYGRIIPRDAAPKPKEAAKKPRKKDLGVILAGGVV